MGNLNMGGGPPVGGGAAPVGLGAAPVHGVGGPGGGVMGMGCTREVLRNIYVTVKGHMKLNIWFRNGSILFNVDERLTFSTGLVINGTSISGKSGGQYYIIQDFI